MPLPTTIHELKDVLDVAPTNASTGRIIEAMLLKHLSAHGSPELPELSQYASYTLTSPHRKVVATKKPALTNALAFAREAVQLDATNDNPKAAIELYRRSVALLNEVIQTVRKRGERGTIPRQDDEEELRRLQEIVSE